MYKNPFYAFAVGTGVGINTVMAAKLGADRKREADEYIGVGTPLAVAMWFLFTVICWLIMPLYAKCSELWCCLYCLGFYSPGLGCIISGRLSQ